MNKKRFVVALTGLMLTLPIAASALSISDLQGQIQDLLAKISSMQNGNGGASTVMADVSMNAQSPRICGILNRNLVRGAQGDDVRSLQEFLSSEGYFSVAATGYFGPATANAVARWQSNAGVQSVGSVGPLTRDLIKKRCGNQYGFRVTPQSGNAPLTVTAFANVGGFTIYRYAVDFGDGSAREPIACSAPADACTSPGEVAHTYQANGSYIVSLYRTDSSTNASVVIAKESIRVGDASVSNTSLVASPERGPAPLTVNFTFHPSEEQGTYYIEFGDGAAQVMTTQQIYCIRAPCISPAVAQHTYTQPGSYNVSVSHYIACLYSNPRCMIAQPAPLATTVVSVTGAPSGGAPVISGFSGPASLAVNETGTWAISASDPENGRLSYSIVWGDEWARASSDLTLAPDKSTVQETTFTHSYTDPGVYRVQITVTDESGKSAQSSATVSVVHNICTAEYAPVCGRPQGCSNTCAPGMYCTMICRLHDPNTYSNRCQLNNANATYLHDGACTGNETF